MKKNNFFLLVKSFIIFLLITFISKSILDYFTCKNYQCLVFPEKNLWQKIETKNNDSHFWQGTLTHPNYQLKIKIASNLTSQKAQEYTQISLTQIQSLFNNSRSPYPGQLSDEIACQSKYLPETKTQTFKEGLKLTYFSSFMTNRFQYGACLDSQIAFTAQTVFFYCPNTKQWYQLEFIQPQKNLQNPVNQNILDQFSQINCQRPSIKIGKLFP